jgi:NADH dehydrogenase
MAIAARTDLHLVIVGGGATGVELAAELSHYMETLSRYATDEMPTHLRMTLIETGPRLLGLSPNASPNLSKQSCDSSASTLERIRR